MREFVVVGPAQAGKSTFGHLLAAALCTTATDTSEILVEVETKRQRVLAERYKLEPRLSCQKARPDMDGTWKGSWDVHRSRPVRELLVALGDAFVDCLGLDFLSARCLERGRVCVGVRRKVELEALREHRPDIEVIWVSRPGFNPDARDNLDISPEDCDRIVQNSGTKDDLAGLANQIAEAIGHEC